MKDGFKIVLLSIIFVIIVALAGLGIGYYSYKNNDSKDNKIDNKVENKVEEKEEDTNDEDEVLFDLNEVVGTYYNELEPDLYFTLNEDGTATIVETNCGDGAMEPFNVSYTVKSDGDNIILEFAQDDRIMSQVLIGSPYGDSIRYTVTEETCVATPNETFYYKK